MVEITSFPWVWHLLAVKKEIYRIPNFLIRIYLTQFPICRSRLWTTTHFNHTVSRRVKYIIDTIQVHSDAFSGIVYELTDKISPTSTRVSSNKVFVSDRAYFFGKLIKALSNSDS